MSLPMGAHDTDSFRGAMLDAASGRLFRDDDIVVRGIIMTRRSIGSAPS